ncbi:MAG: NAD(P)H-binding protein [Pseudomonadota bacterium]
MILITGANGNLGRRLLRELAGQVPLRAVVRSQRAADTIGRENLDGVEVRIIDYLDEAAMTEAAEGCSHIVHLVGIIKESAGSSFEAAHEGTTAVVIAAARAAGVERIVYLSILGTSEGSSNACLASKARAEGLLLASGLGVLVLRVPMVLGEGDYATRALAGRARGAFALQFRAGSLEQPIYAGDVVQAMLAGLDRNPAVQLSAGALEEDLAGPESLTRAALTGRAAAVLGETGPRILSLPVGLGLLMAGLLERLSANPPVSRAMLGVLDHDDQIDPSQAALRLGVALTPLDEALRATLVESP